MPKIQSTNWMILIGVLAVLFFAFLYYNAPSKSIGYAQLSGQSGVQVPPIPRDTGFTDCASQGKLTCGGACLNQENHIGTCTWIPSPAPSQGTCSCHPLLDPSLKCSCNPACAGACILGDKVGATCSCTKYDEHGNQWECPFGNGVCAVKG